jgi:hypothetical protein
MVIDVANGAVVEVGVVVKMGIVSVPMNRKQLGKSLLLCMCLIDDFVFAKIAAPPSSDEVGTM